MRSPHILLATGNVARMRANLVHLLDAPAVSALDAAISANVVGLFRLGEYHFSFGASQPTSDWRQRVSRLYYGAYNVQRAIRLHETGSYSTDSTDHKKINELPGGFPRSSFFAVQLPVLREDRNLCDYDHSAVESDLAISVADAVDLVRELINEGRAYLASRGVVL